MLVFPTRPRRRFGDPLTAGTAQREITNALLLDASHTATRCPSQPREADSDGDSTALGLIQLAALAPATRTIAATGAHAHPGELTLRTQIGFWATARPGGPTAAGL